MKWSVVTCQETSENSTSEAEKLKVSNAADVSAENSEQEAFGTEATPSDRRSAIACNKSCRAHISKQIIHVAIALLSTSACLQDENLAHTTLYGSFQQIPLSHTFNQKAEV